MSVPDPQPSTVTERRLLGQGARHDLDDYRRDRGMAFASLDRLKQLARARRKIDRAVSLEGVAPEALLQVIDFEEREKAGQAAAAFGVDEGAQREAQSDRERYGQAIRVMHRGCEEALLAAAWSVVRYQPNEALASLSVAQGYAYSLEVMTRQAAPDHIRSALRRLQEQKAWPEQVMSELVDARILTMAEPPHVSWERRQKDRHHQ